MCNAPEIRAVSNVRISNIRVLILQNPSAPSSSPVP
jgi:hypothetical protein